MQFTFCITVASLLSLTYALALPLPLPLPVPALSKFAPAVQAVIPANPTDTNWVQVSWSSPGQISGNYLNVRVGELTYVNGTSDADNKAVCVGTINYASGGGGIESVTGRPQNTVIECMAYLDNEGITPSGNPFGGDDKTTLGDGNGVEISTVLCYGKGIQKGLALEEPEAPEIVLPGAYAKGN